MASSPIRAHPNLQAEAADLVKALGGAWRPQGAMCRCPAHPDRTPSLSVRVGARSLLFKCFAGCTGVEVMQAIRRLKLRVPTAGAATRDKGAAADMPSIMASRAREIWHSARRVEGSLAAAYLSGRGIQSLSPALRYHPQTPIGRGRVACFRPALIAAVRESDTVVAIQRIFLDRHLPKLAPDLERPKLMLGRPRSGAVMLAPAGNTLGVAEGVETAMSATRLLNLPVWAVLGNERLPRVAIPDVVRHLILLPDNDRAGRLAESQAREAHTRAGLVIETIWPWAGLNDWNDVLQAEGEKGNAGCGWWPEGQGAPHLESYP